MHANQSKRPVGGERPFPWRCRHCGKDQVFPAVVSYDAEIRHDGRLYSFQIPDLEIPVCQACGKKVFTEKVDDQINAAFRSHSHLLTPQEMRAGLERVTMTQKEAAGRLGIAEATLSRWLNETQIQSRAMDNLLRVFFAFPQVRAALSGESQDPQLGASDIAGQRGNKSATRSESPQGRRNSSKKQSSWLDNWNGKRQECRQVQEVVQRTGSNWGTEKVA